MRSPGRAEALTPPEQEARSELEASFAAYIRRAWTEADPSQFVEAWHIQAMADALQAVADGQVRNLLIRVPPGMTRSMVASVLWPTWV